MRLCGTELVAKLSLLGCVVLASQTGVHAQDIIRQPISQTVVDRREETVYKEEFVTQLQESQQTYLTPVTEYHWEPRIHGRFNILRPRTVAYHLVPHTRWEARAHTVRTPITYRQLRPETRVVEVPRRELGFSQVPGTGTPTLAQSGDGGTRVAARHHALPSGAPQGGGAPSATITASPQPAPGVIIPAAPPTTIGGVLQMDGDHPRFGAMPVNRY